MSERGHQGQSNEENGRMEAAMRLFSALSGVDEEYLAASETRAQRADKRRSVVFWRRYGRVMAAALCLAAFGTGYFSLRQGVTHKSADLAGNAMTGGTANAGAASDAMNAAMDTDMEDGMAVAISRQQESDGNAASMKNHAGEPNMEVGGGPDAAKIELESAKSESEQTVRAHENGILSIQEATGDGLNDMHKEGVQAAGKEITLAQAMTYEVVGDCLPTVWPSGGEITRVYGNDIEGGETVTMGWTYVNGWDTFLLSVDNLGDTLPDAVEDCLVDQTKPETYDVRLYEIPYADTVPEEYLQVFTDPVFRADDFDGDCVEARMASFSDAGDTDTPRGNFRVLYRSGANYVLVRFNGRGDADEILTMLESVGEN